MLLQDAAADGVWSLDAGLTVHHHRLMRGLRWALVGILAANAALSTLAVSVSTPQDPTSQFEATRVVGLLMVLSLAAVLARGRGFIWIIALAVCILACVGSFLGAIAHPDRMDQWAWAAGFGIAVVAIVGLRYAWPVDSHGAAPGGVDEEQNDAADTGPHRS